MERQNEPLVQKKSWSELTEEEQQAIRECWDLPTPPEEFMYIIGDLVLTENFTFTGNLCVIGNVSEECDSIDITVNGHFIVCGNINARDVDPGDVNVDGDFIVGGDVNVFGDVNVGGNFIVDGDVDVIDVTVLGDFIVRHNIDSCNIKVDGLLDCYDVESNSYEIHAADYVCRYYEEEI